MHWKVDLSGPTAIERAAVPRELVGLTQESLNDLSAALSNCPPQFAGLGYWPEVPEDDPTLDPSYERRDVSGFTPVPDSGTKTVIVTYGKVDRPIGEVRVEKIAALKAEADSRFATADILLVLGALYKRAKGTADAREITEIDTLTGVYGALRGALDWIEDPGRTIQEIAGYDVIADPAWP